MKGLLAKDFALIKKRGKVMAFLLVWGVVMNFVMDDNSFAMGWIVMIATIMSFSTVSYDEYDNCMPFLMSMPVTRRSYAVEKYAFSLLFMLGAWVLSLVIMFVCSLFNGKGFAVEDLMGSLLFLPLMMLVLSISVPPQLKWGAERGRIALLLIFGVVFVAGLLAAKFGGGFERVTSWLDARSMGGFVAACFAAGIVITCISLFLSIRIMEKKEF